jgi:hypothetical protein
MQTKKKVNGRVSPYNRRNEMVKVFGSVKYRITAKNDKL